MLKSTWFLRISPFLINITHVILNYTNGELKAILTFTKKVICTEVSFSENCEL